jgi:microcystin-dependent protein
MKLLSILISLYLMLAPMAHGQGDAPPLVYGQEQTTKLPGAFIRTPNKQAIKLGSGKVLLESGNKNLLENAGFEQASPSIFTSPWNSSGTATLTTETNALFGDQSLGVSISASAVEIYQDSAINVDALTIPITGIAGMWVKTSTAGLYVCSRAAGVTSTDNCAEVPATGGWEYVSVYMTFQATTSNGLALSSKGVSWTGTFTIDEAELIPGDRRNTTSAVGAWTTWTPTGSWTGNTTYLGRYRIVGDSLEFQIYISIVTGAPTPAATALTVNMPSGYTVNEGKMAGASTLDSLGFARLYDADTSANRTVGVVGYNGSNAVRVSTTGSSSVTNTVPFTFAAGDIITLKYAVPITELGGNITTVTSSTTALRAGQIITVATATCPTGTIAADGTSYAPTAYPQLYAAIGITHGGVAGTSFNVPDYRGRFLRGVTGASANDPDVASRTAMNTGGNTANNVGSVQGHAFQTHTHVANASTNSGASYNTSSNSVRTGQSNSGVNLPSGTIENASSSGSTDQASANETRPINAYVTYCIRTEDAKVYGSFADFDYVAAAATYASGTQSFTTAVAAVVLFDNEQYDSHSAYNPATGAFTAPKEGWYEGSCVLYYESIALDSGEFVRAQLNIGAKTYHSRYRAISTATNYVTQHASGSYWMDAGETAYCTAYQNSGASWIMPGSSVTSFTVVRIPGQE